jgi:hypothetical protein
MKRFAIPWIFKHSPPRRLPIFLLLMVFVIGCGKSDKLAADKQTASGSSPDTDASQAGDPAGPSELAIPPEIQTVANKLLGSSAEVLAFGDLAHNGHEQALVINRVIATPRAARETAPPETDGVPFTRAAVIERDGARWIQVLRCDEHLTNPKGFLAGAPLSPVTGWRVRSGTQFGNGSDKKDDAAQASFYFSPLDVQDAARAPTIAVRWNPKVNRYQVVDRTSQQFLGELESLETPASTLR